MQFTKQHNSIDFIGKKKLAFGISAIMILISICSIIIHKGLNYGIDFDGGTLIQIKLKSKTDLNQIKDELYSAGFEKITMQTYGSPSNGEFIIKTNESITKDSFFKRIKASTGINNLSDYQIRRIEAVGPQIGKQLREKALLAVFYALLLTTIYISGRFEFKWASSCVVVFSVIGLVYLLSLSRLSITISIILALSLAILLFKIMKFRYAMGAMVALLHDVTITIGFLSIFDKEFSLSIIAAILTTVGYSLNDTIIVFDRVRENLKKPNQKNFEKIINKSINETLSRTILTSFTTLLVVVTLFIFGGEIIRDFAFTMIVGIFVGTYSSIYVASPILFSWQNN